MVVVDFAEKVSKHGGTLSRRLPRILQINLGKLCNQTCNHCHVDAGPHKKRENMGQDTLHRIQAIIQNTPSLETVDLTGGAPEMNPYFRELVRFCRNAGKNVIDRCNLTVLFEPGQQDTAAFLAELKVHVVASLPCYSTKNVDQQRGNGVFEKSIRGLQLLNELGYGRTDSDRILDLVYNPAGPHLPPSQQKLEADYKEILRRQFGIEFNHLLTITNMPIKRFLADLRRQGKEQEYMDLLVESFNPGTLESIMCRDLISMSWDGQVFDCDFNQMLGMQSRAHSHIGEINSLAELISTPIATGPHCFGCTAGSGSSCGGSLTTGNPS